MASTIQLSSDESFNYEILRALSHTRYSGADIGEVLRAASLIEPGNLENFYDVFHALAVRVSSQANAIDATKNPISARDAYFRAATYFRTAGFYLDGSPDDPRINGLWDEQLVNFDKAIALLPIPGERLLLKGDGFDIPTVFYRAGSAEAKPKPRPTILVSIGYDSGQEEVFHAFGFAALERGYNVMTYEGPGQGSVRRHQGVGFTHAWEKAVSPVVDHLVARPDVDSTRLAMIGWSLGGYLCVRAAAFEHRLAATLAIDGVYDFSLAVHNLLPAAVRAAYVAGDSNEADSLMQEFLASEKLPTTMRWAIEHGLWSFATRSISEFIKMTERMTLQGVVGRVECPVLVAEAVDDIFFKGQPALVAAALGDRATHLVLTAEDAASPHCHAGAFSFANHLFYDWLENVFSSRRVAAE